MRGRNTAAQGTEHRAVRGNFHQTERGTVHRVGGTLHCICMHTAHCAHYRAGCTAHPLMAASTSGVCCMLNCVDCVSELTHRQSQSKSTVHRTIDSGAFMKELSYQHTVTVSCPAIIIILATFQFLVVNTARSACKRTWR